MITKRTSDFSDVNFVDGESILIDKPKKWSSFRAVYEVRKIVRTGKVGHAGTLDPMATGLLIINTGKKTKQLGAFQEMRKTYTGTITLGASTHSLDAETDFIEELGVEGITDHQIIEAVQHFIGEIEQIPPMYSAANYGGKKLYSLARKGKIVPRESKNVTVYQFKITELAIPKVKFLIECSKGTYIRSIAQDLGAALGCGGYLSALRREKIGEYSVDDALTPQEFKLLSIAGHEREQDFEIVEKD